MSRGQRNRKKTHPTYEMRARSVRRCGFTSYAHYIRSSQWSEIRDRVLERDGGMCRFCGRPASQVHHMSYGEVTLRGDRIDKLLSCCASCHCAIEFTPKGNKRSLAEARKQAARMLRDDWVPPYARRLSRAIDGDRKLTRAGVTDRMAAGKAIRNYLQEQEAP